MAHFHRVVQYGKHLLPYHFQKCQNGELYCTVVLNTLIKGSQKPESRLRCMLLIYRET